MNAPVFTAREVLQFAVRNEREGETFYRQVAARTENPAVQKLFLMLAKEETLHERIFLQMLDDVDRMETINTDPGEYVAYMLDYFTENVLFATNRADELPPDPVPLDALNFGIRRELDSIFYYTQAKYLMSDRQRKVVDKIIAEERGHFLKLLEFKRICAAEAGLSPKAKKKQGLRRIRRRL